MHIYALGLQAKTGRALEAAAYAIELAAFATKVGGQPTIAWVGTAGCPNGTFALTTRFDSFGAMAEARAAYFADPGFAKLNAAGAEVLAGPVLLQLNKVVAASPDYVPKPILSVTNATIAVGHMSATLAWSADMFQYAGSITGAASLLTISTAGMFGVVGFASSFDSLDEFGTADEKLTGDAGYISRLDATGGLFEVGAATILAERIN